MAERAGFEPAVPYGTPDFESGTFDHSATSPQNIFLEYHSFWQTFIPAKLKFTNIYALARFP